jgi:O-antigen ligase
MIRLVRHRRRLHESAVLPLAGAALGLALAVAGIWYIARETIETRAALTRDQLQAMLGHGNIGARATLYHDTWTMAKDKLWFGWGMGSYPHVFTLYNSQTSVDKLPVFYRDAHSDWLQALAEHGILGSALLALCAILPLWQLRRRHFTSAIPAYLLGGCMLILLYAWVEFPYGNLAVVLAWWVCFFCAVQYARLQEREAPPPRKLVPPVTRAGTSAR